MININDYDYFIFDCDGVLINSNEIKNETFRQVLKNEKENLVIDFINYHQQNGGVSRYQKFLHYYKNIKKIKDYENNASLAINEFSAIVEYKLVKSDYVNGVIEFLKTIFSYKKKIYIVSGGDQKELVRVFKKKGILNFFNKVFGSPNDKIYNTRKVLKLNEKNHSGIFFGDSKLDYICAKKYKLDFIYVKMFSEWKNYTAFEKDFLLTINDFSNLSYK